MTASPSHVCDCVCVCVGHKTSMRELQPTFSPMRVLIEISKYKRAQCERKRSYIDDMAQ